MKLLFLIFTLIVVAACSPKHDPWPQAEVERTMSDAGYLRKLSFHLRGHPPTSQEYERLSKTNLENREAFFAEMIGSYLDSEEFVDKMEFRLEELFSMPASPTTRDRRYEFDQLPSYFESPHASFSIYNSLNALFRQTLRENRSWDTLLLGKTYELYPNRDQVRRVTDGDFYSAVHKDSKKGNKAIEKIQFEAGDPRIAGALTTSRFFQRYTNTNLNKNRRRAAAVFKIFLCDDMNAVVVDESSNQDPILDIVYPGTDENTYPHPVANLDEDRHGNDKACAKCHDKLDPMGRAFQNSGPVLAPRASWGKLVFQRQDGSWVNESVHGLGGLSRAITRQEKYLNCQVKHFWDWFIGRDIELTDTVQAELALEFRAQRKRPKDFVKLLVMREEFRNPHTNSAPQIVQDVKGILANCNSCHSNEGIPSFTSWPIGGSVEKHQAYLRGIRDQLGLNGGKRQMPPENSSWQPSSAQLETMKKWYELGAPDENGRKHIN